MEFNEFKERMQKHFQEMTKDATHLFEVGVDKDTDLTPDEIKAMQAELAEYKNKLADGRMFELPCKVGDTVWCIFEDKLQDMKKPVDKQPKPFYKVTSGIIRQFMIDTNCGFRFFLDSVRPSTVFESEIGITAFFSYEEAEKALKERGQNDL